MQNNTRSRLALALFVTLALPGFNGQARAQAEKSAYPAMLSLDQYLIADKNAEIELARSGAPPSISEHAEVMVLGRDGYTTAANGTNGFLCIVERGWGAATDEPEFWNPKIRAPICFNGAAATTFARIYLMKTKLVLAGKSKAEIAAAVELAREKHELPELAPGAMCYMLSKQQYLNDRGKSWHPHLMFFVCGGDVGPSWGADMAGSPLMAASDPEEGVTIMMVWVGKWSDGSLAPASSM